MRNFFLFVCFLWLFTSDDLGTRSKSCWSVSVLTASKILASGISGTAGSFCFFFSGCGCAADGCAWVCLCGSCGGGGGCGLVMPLCGCACLPVIGCGNGGLCFMVRGGDGDGN